MFCDEEGDADRTMRYVGGIGLYRYFEDYNQGYTTHINHIFADDGTIIAKGCGVTPPKFVGMQGVFEESDKAAIYTIEGLQLNVIRDELSPGFYIINGKKMFVN